MPSIMKRAESRLNSLLKNRFIPRVVRVRKDSIMTDYADELSRLKKLEADGKIKESGFDYSDLEDLAKKIIKWRKGNTTLDKYLLTRYGSDQDLDELVHDSRDVVRLGVAERGRSQDLNILVSDKDWHVRIEVARQGRGKDLDILVGDQDWSVRCAVAECGRDKNLDILVHDKSDYVRQSVAWKGRSKDLDKLIDDENENIRETADFLKAVKGTTA